MLEGLWCDECWAVHLKLIKGVDMIQICEKRKQNFLSNAGHVILCTEKENAWLDMDSIADS